MSSCSIFKNFHKPIDKKSLILIAKDIASDKYKAPVEKIRSLLEQGKTEEAQELKKQLPAFTPSAVFKNRRVKEEVEIYSGFVHLDFDKLTDEQIGKVRSSISCCPYTHVYFVSPSGRGIKVFIEVSSGKEYHDKAYRQVQAYYENLAGLKADPSCKDITRLCFVSYDPDIFRNLENEKFPVKGERGRGEEGERIRRLDANPNPLTLSPSHPSPHPLTPSPSNPSPNRSPLPLSPSSPDEEIFQQQVQFTNRIKTYEKGSRNAYVYQLASNCNRVGLSEQTTINLITRHFDLSQKEVEQTARSAYKRSLESQNVQISQIGQREGLGGLGGDTGYEIRDTRGASCIANRESRITDPVSAISQLSQPSQPSQPSQLSQDSQESQLSHPSLFSQTGGEQENVQEPMPTLPDVVFDTLPPFLQQVTGVAKTKEERDILLLGSLTTLSVALHQVVGRYDDVPVNANLFLFVSAMASAGKGILIHCRKLVLPIHLELREEARLMKQRYDAEMVEYHLNKTKNPDVQRPRKPAQKMLIGPANNSATGFLEIMGDSDSRMLIFETEGDTLSNAFNSEHGNFSDGFRNSFQHEPISYYRRTDKEHVEIERPCLSVVLSGTPRQVKTLIPGVENGLFSRFVFYVMNMSYQWKNVFASRTDQGLVRHFEQLGQQFYHFYRHLSTFPEMHFSLSTSQQERFNAFFSRLQNLYITIQDEDIISSVRRLGLTAYRIMMIFTGLRLMESGAMEESLVCEEVDFDNTLQMIAVLVQHSSHVFTQVAEEQKKKQKPKNVKEQFLECLPAEFSRQAFLEVSRKLAIPQSTASRYIRKFEEAGLIHKPSYDNYIKLPVGIPGKG